MTSQRLGYARVSSTGQSLDRQTDALNSAGVSRIWTDKLSGARADRPGLLALLDHAREGDAIVVASLDRLGRSTLHVLETVRDLEARGIGLHSLKEQIDTSTPAGRFLLVILAGLAEMERELINERAAEGRAAAAARGKQTGRPKAMQPADLKRARELRASGLPMTAVAQEVGVSRATLYRALATV